MALNIVTLEEVTEELQDHIRRGELFPIIGSGFTKGCKTKSGQTVPSGSDMRMDMIQYLADHGYHVPENKSFSQVARYYQKFAKQEDFRRYIRERFLGVRISPIKKNFLSLKWKFIYTLNLDDGIEKNSSYQHKILPCHPLHLDGIKDEKCVFKLHGDAEEVITYGDAESILSLPEYLTSLEKNETLLNKLKEDLNYSNTIFIGCSLGDELDLLSVAQQLKNEGETRRNRYFVTDKVPDELEKLELEDYGIDKIILVKGYDPFYRDFIALAKECECVGKDELEEFHNLECGTAHPNKNIDYMLFGKFLLDKKRQMILFPDFFITRDQTKKILDGMEEERIQIIYGSRVSGKSYLLADLLRNIRNRDTYYFDSRNQVNEKLLKELLKQRNSVLFFDTNVLSSDAVKYLLNGEISGEQLKRDKINIVFCINNSDQEILGLIGYTRKYLKGSSGYIRCYELKNQFTYGTNSREGEFERVNKKLRGAGDVLPFMRNCTILDSLISIQSTLRKNNSDRFDPNIEVQPGDVGKLCLLILLALNEKVTAQELVKCRLMAESSTLLKEISLTVEEDHRSLLMLSTMDSASYQIVCTAKIWLLNQMKELGEKEGMNETVVEAFRRLVQSFLGETRHFKRIEGLTKFDKINELFPGDNTLIVKIYEGLRPILVDSYQYHHQYSKCRTWGMKRDSYTIEELKDARLAALRARQMAGEALDDKPGAINHQVAYAHILYTLTKIQTKMCDMENYKEGATVSETIDCFSEAIRCPENRDAMTKAKNFGDEDGGIIKKWINSVGSLDIGIKEQDKRKLSELLSRWREL